MNAKIDFQSLIFAFDTISAKSPHIIAETIRREGDLEEFKNLFWVEVSNSAPPHAATTSPSAYFPD